MARRVRRILIAALALVLILLALVGGAAGWLYARADTSTVGELSFANELKIPPLLEPEPDDEGRLAFDLRVQTGTTELVPGRIAETWGMNGPHLGPTLRLARGDRAQMHVRNDLPVATTLHWHGMHLPAVADGNPHQPVEPGETWSPAWTIDQPAATLWYHPHPHPDSEDQVYRGVVGMFILDDAESDRLPIPKSYGVDDVPLILQDVKLDGEGRLDFSKGPISPTGLLGDRILVNGTLDPHFDVTAERTRLRLLNASNARVYDVGIDDGRAFDLIATDGGLLEGPVRMERVLLSPGERAEIVVALSPGERIVLRSHEPDLGANAWESRFSGGDDSFDLLELRAGPTLRPSPPLPRRLVSLEPVAGEISAERSFELTGQSAINGKEMDLSRIDVETETGAVEAWEVRNGSGTPHNFHVHDVRFRVLGGGDSTGGWKDTVYVPPGETVRFLVRFGEHSDPRTAYMFHCHVLQHQDRGMMGQFVVTE